MNDLTIPITKPTSVITQTSTGIIKQETKYPTEIVDLPSHGILYPDSNPLSSGKVEIKIMTAKEEDILTNENLIKKGQVLDTLLESLIIDKSIKVSDLLIGDKNALFIAIRRLAYGDSYGPLQIKCNSCGVDNNTNIDLSQIKEREYDLSKLTKGENKFSFVLPYSKIPVEFKILTHNDEQEIDVELKAMGKIHKNMSFEVTTRLKHVLLSVNGNPSKSYIANFVNNELMSRDSIALRKYVKECSPDLDMSFNFECKECQSIERVGVPMTVQFFWPES